MPLFALVSPLDPALIQIPTVAVFVPGMASLATVRPLGSTEVLYMGDTALAAVAKPLLKREIMVGGVWKRGEYERDAEMAG